MKTTSLLILLIITAFQASSQIVPGGTLDAERKLLNATTVNFTIESASASGHIVVECAVNREGVVTGTKTLIDQSTVKSTPNIIKAENKAKKLTFTPGTKYAPFEHVKVKYTFKKVAPQPSTLVD